MSAAASLHVRSACCIWCCRVLWPVGYILFTSTRASRAIPTVTESVAHAKSPRRLALAVPSSRYRVCHVGCRSDNCAPAATGCQRPTSRSTISNGKRSRCPRQRQGRAADFWATWCTGCKSRFRGTWVRKKYKRRGTRSIGVAMDERLEGGDAVPAKKTDQLSDASATRISPNVNATSLPIHCLSIGAGESPTRTSGWWSRAPGKQEIRMLLQER